MSLFKKSFSLEERKTMSEKFRKHHPDKIPLVVEKGPSSKLAQLEKSKYIVPSTLKVGELLGIIRSRIKLSSEEALFVFVGNGTVMPPVSENIGVVYEKFKDEEDGFLYVSYNSENTFGN